MGFVMRSFIQIQIKYYLILVFLLMPLKSFSQIIVPVSNQADLIAKVLMMNKNLKKDGKPVVIGILYNSKSKSSSETVEELENNFDSKRIKVKNLPITFIEFDINSFTRKGIEEAITSSTIDVLYIAPTRGIDLNSINNICKENKILTISAEPSNTEKYFTVGFDIINNNIKIIINLQSMYAEKVDFSSYLLKVAKVINE
jgi:hypothetical protein